MSDRTRNAQVVEAVGHMVRQGRLSTDDMAALLMLDQGQEISVFTVPDAVIKRLQRFGCLENRGMVERARKSEHDDTEIASAWGLSEYGRRKCHELREAGLFESVLMPD